MANPVLAPTLDLDAADLADWLELSALFDDFGVARLDALQGALIEQFETAEENIGERDRNAEAVREAIENEVDLRSRCLGDAYPFRLDDRGEELFISDEWQLQKFSFYLVCLITTHVTGSVVLGAPPVGDLLIQLRNKIFQMVATFGLAGLSVGPAFSVGWPRQSGGSITDLLTRAAAAGGGFTVRTPPGQYVPPQEKDGGVDVIAWTEEGTPPPTVFYFGQTASGKNWPGKPVADHARVFINSYMLDQMTGNKSFVTVIPYRIVDDAFWHSQHLFHMAILDRLRLPRRALQGLSLAADGTHIDYSDKVDDLSTWINEYIAYASAR